jgi:hypothetical protein
MMVLARQFQPLLFDPGVLMSYPTLLNLPFYLAGGLKIIYDVLLYRNFKATRPPEEIAPTDQVRPV